MCKLFRDKWVPVTTAWRVLRLRMEERPPIWRVKFTLEQTTMDLKGNRCIAVLFALGARWGGWSTPRPGRFTPGKDPVTIV
jgi:hypothetical protein